MLLKMFTLRVYGTTNRSNAKFKKMEGADLLSNREFSRYVFQITVYANAGVAKQYRNRFIREFSRYVPLK
jgi:hypothetical protein